MFYILKTYNIKIQFCFQRALTPHRPRHCLLRHHRRRRRLRPNPSLVFSAKNKNPLCVRKTVSLTR